MPWVKWSDQAAFHRLVMVVLSLPAADARSVNEVFGFISRLAVMGGAAMTYVVSEGVAAAVGGSETPRLLDLSVAAGLLERIEENGLPAYRLVDDPELFHIREKEEVEFERQRKRDTYSNNPDVIAVRFRDGDQCRWCGVFVQPMGQTNARSLSIDHLVPGGPGTIENMLVTCQSCNSRRKNDVETWAARHPLRPVPDIPRYGRATAKYLTNHGYPVACNHGPHAPQEEIPGLAVATPIQGAPVGARLSPGISEAAAEPVERAPAGSMEATPIQGAPVGARLSPAVEAAPIPARGAESACVVAGFGDAVSAGKSLDVEVSGCGKDPPKSRRPGSGRDGQDRKREGTGVGSGLARDGSGLGRAGSGSRRRRARARRRGRRRQEGTAK